MTAPATDDYPGKNAAPDLPWHAADAGDVLAVLQGTAEGLSSREAAQRLTKHGRNVIERASGDTVRKLLWRQIDTPLVWVLLGSAAIAMLLGKVLDGGVVLAVVVLNGIIGFVQEFRASKAIEALSTMVPEDATVLRDGAATVIPVPELVPGDIVTLVSGDKVPADLRLIAANRLQTNESALTGESLPVEKSVLPVEPGAQLGDRVCMAYGGTLVTSGTGTGAVAATGRHMELGRISSMLGEAEEHATPLTQTLARIARHITAGILAVAVIILIVGTVRGLRAGVDPGTALRDTFVFAIALAVGAIPEGLPAIVTITLAVGVQRMARRRAIIRKLPAAETLGSTTVICTDKTGTLTRNEMTVTEMRAGNAIISVSGVGYAPQGEFFEGGTKLVSLPEHAAALLRDAVLCSDAALNEKDGVWTIAGDPTEGALVVAARKAEIEAETTRRASPRLDTFPFESEHRFMATLHQSNGVRHAVMKGAPEAVLARCGSGLDTAAAVRNAAEMAAKGLRVLAVAHREGAEDLEEHSLTGGFVLSGLLGMVDPPRPEALEAVRGCRGAGITVKMITGDHPDTAQAIAREFGMTGDTEPVTGRQLAEMDDAALAGTARRCNVFARVAPEHKLRLVRALQRQGEVVAMTGDGVNDAPALKQSNIGIAMGITGTAVAKESADMILADDNFASIAAAVEEGRRIFDNLVRSLAFVLPTNLGLALILMYAVFFLPFDPLTRELLLPMLPVQILWINLVATVGLALPLAFEAKEPDLMTRPPRGPDTPLLGAFVIQRTLLTAALMTASSVGLFYWEYVRSLPQAQPDPEALGRAQTMAVTTVIFFQMCYLLQCRSLRDSLLRVGVFTNPAVFAGIGGVLAMQLMFVYAPWMHGVFGSQPLTPRELALAAAAGALVLPLIALEKWLRPKIDRILVPETDPRLVDHASLSKDFDALLHQANGRPMAVGTMMDRLALRGHAFLLLFFSLPLCLPVGIPVLTTILGPVLVFVSFFLLRGRRTWLPKRMRDHEVPYERMEGMIRRVNPLVLRIEKHLYPRLLALSEPGLPVRVHAAYILALSLVVSLPMPILFANLVAAVPILLLSLGLIKRDGLFIIAAYVAALPCIALYGVLAFLGFEGLQRLFGGFL